MEIKQAGDQPQKSGRGGARPGAGRKKKGHTAPTALAPIDLASALNSPPPDEIEGLARRHARTAIDALVKQLIFGASESAKVAAANAILDRGYGKPTVEAGGDAMLPFLGTAPAKPSIGSEIRDEARKHSTLAVEVLKRIADNGASESARVSASRSLLDRGLGTVAPARLVDDMFKGPALGKKEEAARRATEVATGRFATPAPPRIVTHQ